MHFWGASFVAAHLAVLGFEGMCLVSILTNARRRLHSSLSSSSSKHNCKKEVFIPLSMDIEKHKKRGGRNSCAEVALLSVAIGISSVSNLRKKLFFLKTLFSFLSFRCHRFCPPFVSKVEAASASDSFHPQFSVVHQLEERESPHFSVSLFFVMRDFPKLA